MPKGIVEPSVYERIDKWPNRVVAHRQPPVKYVSFWSEEAGRQVTRQVPTDEERWVVVCHVGLVYVWEPQTDKWVLARNNLPLEEYAMPKERALELLNTVEIIDWEVAKSA